MSVPNCRRCSASVAGASARRAPSSRAKPSSTAGGHTPDISVDKFEIVDGAVHIGRTGNSAGQMGTYQGVHLVAHNISSTTAMRG